MFKLRKLDESKGDLDFVVKYWLDSYRVTGWFGQNVRARFYTKYHKGLIHTAIEKCQTVVIEDEKIEGLLIGFVNYIPGELVNYLYIKKDFRDMGLGEQLLKLASGDSREVFYTHDIWMPAQNSIILNFNPYPFLRGDYSNQGA